jgi:hypothetical protein
MACDHEKVTANQERLLDAITASLERSMRGEPSPEFLARVRDHLARERARPVGPDGPPWLAAAAPVAVALAVVAALVWKLMLPVPEDTDRIASAPPAARVARAAPIGPVNAPAAPVIRSKPRTGRVAREAEILVEPGQLEALVRVATGEAASVAPFAFVVHGLEAATTLPALQPVELPRFKAKSLQVASPRWGEPTSGDGGVISEGNEGSEP